MDGLAPIVEEAGECRQYISFFLAGEEYGLDILHVQEITEVSAITRVPNLPACIKGVVNLRGVVVPVIDARLKLGYPAAAYGKKTAMIVLRLDEGCAGLIVDAVDDVITLADSSLSAADDPGLPFSSELAARIGRVDGRVVMVMDWAKAISCGSQ